MCPVTATVMATMAVVGAGASIYQDHEQNKAIDEAQDNHNENLALAYQQEMRNAQLKNAVSTMNSDLKGQQINDKDVESTFRNELATESQLADSINAMAGTGLAGNTALRTLGGIAMAGEIDQQNIDMNNSNALDGIARDKVVAGLNFDQTVENARTNNRLNWRSQGTPKSGLGIAMDASMAGFQGATAGAGFGSLSGGTTAGEKAYYAEAPLDLTSDANYLS